MATWDTTTTTIVIHTWITEITGVTSLTAEVAIGAHVTVIELQVTLLYLKLIMCLKFPTIFSFFFVCLNGKSFISFINFSGRIWLAIHNNRMPRKMFATFAINTEKNHITLSYLLSNMIHWWSRMLYHIQPTSMFLSRCKNKTRPRISKKLDFELGFGWVLHDLLKSVYGASQHFFLIEAEY